MSGFRKPQQVTRITPGEYVDGIFIPGTESTFTIQASVQPMSGEDQLVIPAGSRLSDFVKLYTDTELLVLDEVTGQQPDKLSWRDHLYECIQVDARRMDVISHWKCIFSKLNQT